MNIGNATTTTTTTINTINDNNHTNDNDGTYSISIFISPRDWEEGYSSIVYYVIV